MPRPTKLPELQGVEAYQRAARSPASTLKQRYRDDPEGLANRLGLTLPEKPVIKMLRLKVITKEEAQERFGTIEPGLREFVLDVCNGKVTSAVAVANRGGGKSYGVSFIEFFLWMILDYDAINLGGSELQAMNVYGYLVEYINSHPEWQKLIKGEVKVSESKTMTGSWIKVLTASSKSVRSPHAGGIRTVNGIKVERGGLLVIDEEAECEPDIVETSLATINTARPSVNCRTSTFHNEFGTFQEVVDNAEEMGYTKYKWDCFDVCSPCDCVGQCQSEEPCFRDDHFEEYADPDTGEMQKRLVHRAFCGGRAMYAEGWVPYNEIVTIWKRMKRNHSKFEIEMMGSRPGSSGFVIKDRQKFIDSQVDEDPSTFYLPGFPVSVCVDWGTHAAGVTVWQGLPQGRHVLLEADLVEDAGLTQIMGVVTGYATKYVAGFQEIAADIGGGGNYLNPLLREKGFECRDVVFNEEKESSVAAWNITNEAGLLIIPKKFTDFIKQVTGWRRKDGRIVKKNDHLCDSGVCYFAKFADELGTSQLRIVPKSFVAGHVNGSMPILPESVQKDRTASAFSGVAGTTFTSLRRR